MSGADVGGVASGARGTSTAVAEGTAGAGVLVVTVGDAAGASGVDTSAAGDGVKGQALERRSTGATVGVEDEAQRLRPLLVRVRLPLFGARLPLFLRREPAEAGAAAPELPLFLAGEPSM